MTLSKLEQKYCSCILSVMKKDINPYGLCTNSVYGSRNLTRKTNPLCATYYKFEKYDLSSLREYAKSKKVKITENSRYKSKDKLVLDLYKYVSAKYNSK